MKGIRFTLIICIFLCAICLTCDKTWADNLSDFEDSSFMGKLADPNMRTKDEIRRMRDQCRLIGRILLLTQNNEIDYQRREFTIQLIDMITTHLSYNRDSPDNRLVNLAKSSNPALVKMREIVNLPPPPGFAFVRYLDEPEEVSYSPTGERDEGNGRPGYLYLTRYITIDRSQCLDQKTDQGKEQVLHILSHELVHSYITSSMGIQYQNALPKWFQEGLAVFITGDKAFELTVSKEGEDKKTRTIELCKEYKKYNQAFQFLYFLKGEECFNRFVTRSISTHNASEALSSIYNIKSTKVLNRAAKNWAVLNNARATTFFITALFLVLAFSSNSRGLRGLYFSLTAIFMLIAVLLIPHLQRIV